MKKHIFYLPVILLILILSGCGGNKETFEKNSQIYEYFPFNENVLFEYEGDNNQHASYKVYNTFINQNKLQRILLPPNYDKQTEIFEVKDGELRLINGDTFYYHYENQTEYPPQKDLLILKEPLKLGAKWTISGNDMAEVTGVDVEVTTPEGSFKALEVTSAFEKGYMQKDYYVKNIGLIKTTYSSQSASPVTSTLAKHTENTGISCEVKCYYPVPGSDDISIYYTDIELRTNYDLLDLVNGLLYKSSPDGLYEPLLKKGKITDIIFASNTSAIQINFDKDAYDQGYESEDEERSTLFSIAYTVGKLLAVDQVFLQVEGKPYSGVYVKLAEDEAYIIE